MDQVPSVALSHPVPPHPRGPHRPAALSIHKTSPLTCLRPRVAGPVSNLLLCRSTPFPTRRPSLSDAGPRSPHCRQGEHASCDSPTRRAGGTWWASPGRIPAARHTPSVPVTGGKRCGAPAFKPFWGLPVSHCSRLKSSGKRGVCTAHLW